ncbi:MAG TPA: DUF4149 domain-containing protein [Pyrinomonadaceae bacterium]|jgi:hypothetical protein|nr:DUF4149 domain-containing protein [Pyrinomonadaceae bacterium]
MNLARPLKAGETVINPTTSVASRRKEIAENDVIPALKGWAKFTPTLRVESLFATLRGKAQEQLLQVTNRIRIALLAAWLGLAVYFSAVVAPSAFGVLRSFDLGNANEIAGTIVSRGLTAVNKSGLLLSALLLIFSPAVKKYYGRRIFILQGLLLFVVAAATTAGEFVIAARMRNLRLAMNGHIDQVPLTDPNRIAFASLHGYSVTALSIAIIATLVLILVMIVAREKVDSIPTE